MNEGILSQEEIDALLKNDLEEVNSTDSIDIMDKDILGEMGNISMGTAATTLSTLLGKKVEITTPHVEITCKEKFRKTYPRPYVVIDVQYVDGLEGNNLLIITPNDAAIIADLMMGGTGENVLGELTELQLSAVSEAMNQMMGSASTSMSEVLAKTINISPPTIKIVDLKEEDVGFEDVSGEEIIVMISFNLKIQGLLESKMIQLLPLHFAKKVSSELLRNLEEGNSTIPATNDTESGQVIIDEPVSKDENPGSDYNLPAEEKIQSVSKPAVTVKPVEFAQLTPQVPAGKPQNLDLILDVPLEISVELGRTNKSIEEILKFSTGSIIELNKLAGEPVDMLVNGKLFAKGEVVVIDENFGVRITDIISPLERVKNLQ